MKNSELKVLMIATAKRNLQVAIRNANKNNFTTLVKLYEATADSYFLANAKFPSDDHYFYYSESYQGSWANSITERDFSSVNDCVKAAEEEVAKCIRQENIG